MNLWQKIKYFTLNLTNKHRLSMRSEHTQQEVWYMHISPMNILIGMVTMMLVLFVIALAVVAYTPIFDLVPGYPGSNSREQLIKNILRIDSLEQQMSDLEIYNANMALILSGKSPVTRELLQSDSLLSRAEVVLPSAEDSSLRHQMESSGAYSLNNPRSARKFLRSTMEIFPPVGGVILSHFKPENERFGVAIAAPSGSEVVAIMPGTVISSQWAPYRGTTIHIQHADNMISVYRNNISSRVEAGHRVKAGQVIGYIVNENLPSEGNQMEDNKQIVRSLIKQFNEEGSRFEFELWHNGIPVDPESYILF